jgi:hypothetical protein
MITSASSPVLEEAYQEYKIVERLTVGQEK